MFERMRHVLTIIATARPSMAFVIAVTILLLFVVLAMSAYLLILRAALRQRLRYRARRAELYRPGIELVLMEEPYELVLAALRPRRWGDGDIVQEVMFESIRYLKGPPYETLRRAAMELGFVAVNLSHLYSRDLHRRGHAIERLGLLRAETAIPRLFELILVDRMDLKLVALRALAAIGDPSVLPRFMSLTDRLPPALLPSAAALMIEFGDPGRNAARELLTLRKAEFPTASIPTLLALLAQEWEDS